MTKEDKKIIRKWSKLRHWDYKSVEKSALGLFSTLEPYEKKRMIKEFKDYINEVESGIIKPSPVKLIMPKFK